MPGLSLVGRRAFPHAPARPVWSGLAAGERVSLAHYASLSGANISAPHPALLPCSVFGQAG